MNRTIGAVLCAALFCACSPRGAKPSSTVPSPSPAQDTFHGVTVADPFRWLENGGDPAVASWVAGEDERARAFLQSLPERGRIVEDLQRARAKTAWRSLPLLNGGRYVYARQDAAHERGALFEYDPTTRQESEVLNLDRIDTDERVLAWFWYVAHDGKHAVFSVSRDGSDAVEVRVFDIRARAWLPERIADVRYSYPVWDTDGKGFFYTRSPREVAMSPDKRTAQSQIRYHALHSDPDADPILKGPPNEDGIIEVPGLSSNGRWLVASRWYGTTKNVLSILDRNAKQASWQRITPERDATYQLSFANDTLYLWTNDGAPRGHLFTVDALHPERSAWREIVRERQDASIAHVDALPNHLVIQYSKDGEKEYAVHRLDGTYLRALTPPAQGALDDMVSEPWSNEAAFSFSSYTQPPTAYRTSAPDFELTRFPTAEATSSDAYVTEKIFYTSPDGTRAPIFVVRAKSTPRNAPAPLILHAYGAFGTSTGPHYQRGIETWLDRGGVYAEAVIRGGGEFGDAWHRAGMKENRANVYADFIAASEHLIHDRWTTPAQLVIRGKSAGGLLVATAMTQRPELYAGVVCEVPLTDMIRYRIGGNGPLWIEEFGVPENPSQFKTLFQFSPYHHVARGTRYPWILLMTSADDDRVNPMHGRKFVAALHAADPSATALLRIEPKAAHGGATTASAWVQSEADIYSFARAAVAAHTKH